MMIIRMFYYNFFNDASDHIPASKGTHYKAQTGATGFGVRLVMDFIRNWN